MTYPAILTASMFLLLAFGVERLGRVTGIPSVVVLIAAGVVGKPVLGVFGLELGGLDGAVPVIGTVGLVLIVLEGSFDLALRRDRMPLVLSALGMALAGFVLWGLAFSLLVWVALPLTGFEAVVLSIPFAVISSAVAIPSSRFLPERGREFVVYESSISDILGVLFFFALVGSDGTLTGILLNLGLGGLASLLLGMVFALALLVVLFRLEGHIRFIPLLAGLFALYAAGKLMRLSPLIMVLMFGLMLNNLQLFGRVAVLRRIMSDEKGQHTIKEFKSLTAELTFAVRGFFFILLGYWTDLQTFGSLRAWLAALVALALIYGVRAALLRTVRHEMAGALTWISPRGLITVLLFLNAKEVLKLPAYLDGTVMLVVLFSALAVGVGRMQMAKAARRRDGVH